MSNREKRIKNELRELMTTAYERELEIHLNELYEKFIEWKKGKIFAGELSHLIHQYDKGPSKEMFSRYNNIPPEATVAQGLVNGLLKRDEISDEVYEMIKGSVEFYQNQNRAYPIHGKEQEET